jgi:DNA-binding response OmpR family regulator
LSERRPRVLIADDEEDLRLILRTNLEAEGFEVLTASNGQEALEVIEKEKPDVVLLDVMMPVMDGWEVLTKLASDPTEPTRVMLVTAKAATVDRLQGWELGADDYLTKPFDLDVLIKRIREVSARSAAETRERRDRIIESLKEEPPKPV